MGNFTIKNMSKPCFLNNWNFIKILSLKLLILKDSNQNFATNINRNWAIQFSLMITVQKQNLEMIPNKTIGNMEKTFVMLADFGY